MKIHLHIGVHKTASTLLQRSLQVSNTHKHGVYPLVRDLHPIIGNQLRLLLNGKKGVNEVKKQMALVIKDAKEKGAKTLVISDENLLGNPASVHVKRNDSNVFYPDAKERMKGLQTVLGDDVNVILYTRKQETLIRSLYLDGLKYFRYSDSLEEFTNKCISSEFRFDRLIEDLGTSQLTVIPFEDIKQGTEQFVNQFWESIGHAGCGTTPNKKEQNVAISDLHAEVSRNVAALKLNSDEKSAFRKWLSMMPKQPTNESKIVLSQESTTQIRALYKDDRTYK